MAIESNSEKTQMEGNTEKAEDQQVPIAEAKESEGTGDAPKEAELTVPVNAQDEPAQVEGGTDEATSNARFCPQCGTQLKAGMPFCGNCGAKVEGLVAPTPAARSNKMNIKLIIGGVVAVIVILLVAFLVIPEVTATPDQLIEQGRYEAAYQRASDEEKPEILSQIIGHGQFQIAYDSVEDDQKDDVLAADLAAVLSNDLLDSLKDPSTFVLRQIYFDKDSHEMILEVSASNSSGGRVSNWYDYRFIESDDEYKLYVSISDMSDETVYKYADSADEKLEKTLKNAARANMRTIMGDKDTKLDSIYVDGINELFQSGALGKAELIPAISSIYPESAVA